MLHCFCALIFRSIWPYGVVVPALPFVCFARLSFGGVPWRSISPIALPFCVLQANADLFCFQPVSTTKGVRVSVALHLLRHERFPDPSHAAVSRHMLSWDLSLVSIVWQLFQSAHSCATDLKKEKEKKKKKYEQKVQGFRLPFRYGFALKVFVNFLF